MTAEALFKYTRSNNWAIASDVYEEEGCRRVEKVFERCVSCNNRRFDFTQNPTLRLGENTHFCGGCAAKVRLIFIEVDKKPPEEREAFYAPYRRMFYQIGGLRNLVAKIGPGGKIELLEGVSKATLVQRLSQYIPGELPTK